MPSLPTLLFLTIKWYDVVDILLVAVLIYYLYKLVRGTVAIKIFIGILAIYLLWKVVEAMQINMFSEILGQFIGVGVIALIIVFQQEIRRFLLLIGTSRVFEGSQGGLFSRMLKQNEQSFTSVKPIVEACRKLSKTNTGALIVLAKQSNPSFYVDGGTRLDAELTAGLLESIFIKQSPLHDGAVIVRNNRIDQARCVLPVSKSSLIKAEHGMRHRSALGISENTDAVAIVVSEENGAISMASRGELTVDIPQEELEKKINSELNGSARPS